MEWSPGRVGEEIDWRDGAGLLSKTGCTLKVVILRQGAVLPPTGYLAISGNVFGCPAGAGVIPGV